MVQVLYLNLHLIIAIVIFSGLVSTNEECFNVKDYYWKHLASKTPYRYVANHNDSVINYDGCVPKKIWVVVRHGTRYPNTNYINKMRSRLVEIRDAVRDNPPSKRTLCERHFGNITEWTPQCDLADQKRLTHEGEEEMIELAERFKNRFPSLLDVEYTNSSFQFRSTATERTEKSKYYFTIGLFGRRVAHHVWSPDPIYKDPILRFYKLCTKWLKQVHKNPKAKIEVEKFKSSDEAKKVVQNIVLRLGYEDLTFEDVELMYMTCSYESSWNRASFSPWCSVFSEEDIQVMEFARELKYYWTSGYGHEINFQQACPMMVDFLQHMQSENSPTSTFYFTHSGTLLKLLAHLGLYYDEFKLTHDKMSNPRLWRVSYIDAFGSNLAFVTYQCGNEEKLLTLHQERPVKLPGCHEGLCRFEKILKVTILQPNSVRITVPCYTMALDSDKDNLITIKREFPSINTTKTVGFKDIKNESMSKSKHEATLTKSNVDNRKIVADVIVQREAVEKRQRTGRYLAIGVTLIMLFIAFYHTLLRHASVLAGLLAPAVIMLLYILWLFYFAKKKKHPVSAV